MSKRKWSDEERRKVQEWKTELERASFLSEDDPVPPFDLEWGAVIDWGERLRAMSYALSGVQCDRCGGFGERAYASTATWRGGIGGQSVTTDVCDTCWGTGRSDKTGIDRRRVYAQAEELERLKKSSE